MPQVAEQAVAQIKRGGRHTAQCLAQRDAGRGLLQPQAGLRQQVGWQNQRAAQGIERQPCIAECAADVNIVTRPSPRAQQRLAFAIDHGHFAKHGDADVERPLRGVAADQLAAVRIGQRQQAA